MQRSVLLVSGSVVPLDRDSLPVHALAVESVDQKRAMVAVLGENPDLMATYSSWLAGLDPALVKEIEAMAQAKTKKKFMFDFRPLVEHLGWHEIIRQTGLKPLVEAVGMDQLVAQLTPKQRRELERLLRETATPGS